MKQAQEMQAKLTKAQKELEAQTFQGKAANGGVTATVNGHKDIVSLEFAPDFLTKPMDFVRSSIVLAVKEAQKGAQKASEKIARDSMGGMGALKGLMGL